MTEHSLWRFSRALHRAINERHFADVEALIDENIEWTVHGPVDLFPFLGSRQGKAAVMEVMRLIADKVRVHRFDREAMLLGDESAASMLRCSFTVLDTNKPIKIRLAHFVQFKDGKLASLRILIDTYDMVEQALGVPLRKHVAASA